MGGNANNRSNTGPFYLNSNNRSSNANSNIGRQLSLFHAFLLSAAVSLPLGKTQDHAPQVPVGGIRRTLRGEISR